MAAFFIWWILTILLRFYGDPGSANITRKIKDTQVRALQVMLSGTPEDIQRIQNLGKLDEWCKDNIEWLQDTFGKDNVVSAVLHMDEKTPHIHATIVPIVRGERRKAKAEEDNDKKKYRKKPRDTVRLCADDIVTRNNLKLYQDTYAEKMAKYGLERGIKGSDARHISTPQFYRDLYAKNEDLKEDIEVLQERKEEVYESIRDLYDRTDAFGMTFIFILLCPSDTSSKQWPTKLRRITMPICRYDS